jgi:hypothetical protein
MFREYAFALANYNANIASTFPNVASTFPNVASTFPNVAANYTNVNANLTSSLANHHNTDVFHTSGAANYTNRSLELPADDGSPRAVHKRRGYCHEFQRGACRRGNRCLFAHEIDPAGSKPCWEFLKHGKCQFPKCRFKHITSDGHQPTASILPQPTILHQPTASAGLAPAVSGLPASVSGGSTVEDVPYSP